MEILLMWTLQFERKAMAQKEKDLTEDLIEFWTVSLMENDGCKSYKEIRLRLCVSVRTDLWE